MKLLDLFSGAGGAGMGYHRAGFDVTSIDINPMPNNPHNFIQADALEYVAEHGHEFDAIHASPPCQPYSTIAKQQVQRGILAPDAYPDLIEPIRDLLIDSGKPYIIENVPGAPLANPTLLCGSSFGLDVRRHRLFETSFPLPAKPCDHAWQYPRFKNCDKRQSGLSGVVGVYGHLWHKGNREERETAMGIDWMSPDQLSESIPPAYTEFIGRHLQAHLYYQQNPRKHRTPKTKTLRHARTAA